MAACALEYLVETQVEPTAQTRLYPGCFLILIDLDNSPNFTDRRWKHVKWECCHIAAFAGKMSSHANKDLPSLYPFVDEFHIIDCAMPDAVDHAISVRRGRGPL